MKIHLTSNFTAMVRAHGRTRPYINRFRLRVPAECLCGNGNRAVEHLVYACTKLNNERQNLTAHISKENWPIGKSELVNKYVYLTQII
jgi:hypothetical protein